MLNEKYSYKDFTDQSFVEVDPAEFNNSEIVGSCFSQWDAPDSKVFPEGMTGVTFIKCNLDNCHVPTGNMVETSCCHRWRKVQNDGEIWDLDEKLKPVTPARLKSYQKYKLSVDPKDLPTEPLEEPIITTADLLARYCVEVEKKQVEAGWIATNLVGDKL